MFKRQKGCLQAVIFIGGLICSGFFFIAILSNLQIAITNDFFITATGPQIIRSVGLLIMFTFLGYLGFTINGLFPSIRVISSGIKVKYSLLVQYFAWEELEGIVTATWPTRAKAIIITPKGNLLLNFFKFYPQRIHGLITGVHEPAVILSEGLENREEIIKEIKTHLK